MKATILLFLINSLLFGQEIVIQSVNDFKRIEIVYNLPDYLHPKLIVFSDSTKQTSFKEFQLNQLLRPSKTLKETDYQKEWKKDGRKPRAEIKKLDEYVENKNYYVILASIDECCHNSADILVWRKNDDKIQLQAIYPYYIGGCLYCGVKISSFSDDTLTINVSGGDGGDIYGTVTKYVLDGDLLKNIFYQSYDGFNFEESYNMFYKNYYYDENEKLSKSTIDFINQKNGKDQYAYPKSDSLELHLIRADYMPYEPMYLKTVYVKNDSLKIGKYISHMVTVKWQNEWYITYKKYLK